MKTTTAPTESKPEITLTLEEVNAFKLAMASHSLNQQAGGRAVGIDWAKDARNYPKLAMLVSAFQEKRMGNDNWSPLDLSTLWEAMNPDADTIRPEDLECFNEWCNALGITKYDRDDSDFALGFFDGAFLILVNVEALAKSNEG